MPLISACRQREKLCYEGRTFYSIPGGGIEYGETPEQEAIKGYDPEEPVDDQPIQEVRWMNLNEMSEKDRAFMWRYGLLEIPEFCEEVMSWGDTISYPGNDL